MGLPECRTSDRIDETSVCRLGGSNLCRTVVIQRIQRKDRYTRYRYQGENSHVALLRMSAGGHSS